MANRFWVGGSGTWNNSSTANWSATSGGAPGASAPTTGDDAFFDANSGTAATVTVASTAVSRSTTINKSDISLVLSGNPTLCLPAGTLTLTAGTLNLNSFTLITGRFSSATANARTMAFGANGRFQLTGSAGLIWNTTTGAAALTVTGSRNVEMVTGATTGTRQFAAGNVGESKAWNVKVTAGTDTILMQNHYGNFDLTGFAGTFANDDRTFYGDVTFVSDVTYTAGATSTKFSAATGTQLLTTNGTTHDYPFFKISAGTLRLQDSLTIGSTRTFDLNTGGLDLNNNTLTTGLFSSSSTIVRNIAFGTGNITITGNNTTVWNTDNQTNFTYTGSGEVNFSYAGATGTRAVFCGGANGLITNSINVNVTAGTDTFALQGSRFYKNVNLTGFAGNFTVINFAIYGSFTMSTGATPSSSSAGITFAATSPVTITTASKTFDFPLTFNGVGGTFAFQDALTQKSTRAFTITNGTVQLKNGVTSTVGSFVANNSNVKFLQSTTPGLQATLSQAAGTVNVVNLTIRDINAIGGADWEAFYANNNVDAGNNSNWDFGATPILGTEYTYALRSFTQPRRF